MNRLGWLMCEDSIYMWAEPFHGLEFCIELKGGLKLSVNIHLSLFPGSVHSVTISLPFLPPCLSCLNGLYPQLVSQNKPFLLKLLLPGIWWQQEESLTRIPKRWCCGLPPAVHGSTRCLHPWFWLIVLFISGIRDTYPSPRCKEHFQIWGCNAVGRVSA